MVLQLVNLFGDKGLSIDWPGHSRSQHPVSVSQVLGLQVCSCTFAQTFPYKSRLYFSV